MIEVNLHDVIVGLTTSLDFVGVDELQHGKRVGHMACLVGQALGWDRARCLHVLHGGMLHDCGVSGFSEPRGLDDELDWEGTEGHCARGGEFLSSCSVLSGFEGVARYHHRKWHELTGVAELSDEGRLEANLIYLVDRVDVLFSPFLQAGGLRTDIIGQRDGLVSRIQALGAGRFAPVLVDAFSKTAASDAFWLSMEPSYLDEELIQLGRLGAPVVLDKTDLRSLAGLLLRVIGAKSVHTEEHSRRVAAVSRHLAYSMGYRGDHLFMIEIAGLLHDMGKLRVPSEIIDKPGVLTRDEYSQMVRHSYDTFRILLRIFRDSPIPRWAGAHHENLLGQGYPFRHEARAIEQESRIVSVADIFQALLQDRPYRTRLTGDEVILCMSAMVSDGRLDPAVFSVLVRELDTCVRLATG
ncbi:HD domain-containing protein [Azoarcus sp. L1K30]|uniref:HD-GYP domain-containing protein n=1 Tax=Azoarcus sp. L1K30 TaxID=2820277 RepID=UPI001B818770|nr:HD domain-containing phosphohydrolase [Azoarcus sp. L1K30]MBR0565857.1 HD domain-containing protein [Azoarcus sp. L1K30]